ncbi:breast cancer type 2 susceptibility protein homolog [Nilaparvata lugens]|uniref:breast cancer type 2 susceptibility protein homolog n=1 Tax=Nilaparvata lugens TaxID=108931 RepID=UPI00193E11D6|nr:breast cancer type 2 susceptibility protein homolog [Nilaparvata lugens]
MEENVANDHGSEELTIEYPLSPELNTARIKKKRKRTRKSLNLSVLGLNSDYVTNGSFRVSQESSSNDGSSVFSNNHEMLGKTSYTTLKKDYEALSEASLNEISRTTNNDVLQMLIRDQDKNVIGDQDNKLTSELNCSNTDNTLKKDGGLLDLEKSPILSTNTLKKDGGLLDLEKSPILSTNTLKKGGGLLNLERSPILSTNTLKKDGGLLYLEKSPILSTNTLKKDGGLLDLEKSPILSTNTLKKDGGLLDLEKSPILSTNTLKKDGGLLDFEKSPILSTKTLKKDGGLLDLEKSPILSTNTLKKDGGLLDLEKSPILTTKTLKKDEGLLEFEKSPILSNNPLNKDGRLPDLEKSPILNSNCHIKKYRRLKKRKILNDTNVNDEYANVSKSNHLQKNESQCRDSNMLPNEFSDLSFSILEEICQTTELSFNRDKDDLKSSNDDDLSKIKSASVLCGKLSSNLGKKEKKSVCDKLVTTNFKVIERDNNSDVTSRIVIDSNDSDRRCGSIYISNSIRERKPIANSGSISTLLESAKLLDDSESVSYLEETKKQKDFKLMCRKEKLNDGSYICFESISKGNYKNDNHDRGASKIRGRNDNKVLFDKSSLMDKYNIDMNNTLNISSQQFDDLISCAEKLNSSEKTKVGINSRLEMNSKSSIEFHEQQKTLNEIKTGLLRYCPSNGLSEEESCKPTIPANSSKKIPHFQKLETNKSMLSEKGNRNATIPSKLSKIMRNEAHTRNDPIESETLVKSVETDNVDKLLQEWVFKKDREALICEKDNTTSAKCFEQRMTSEQSKLELGLVGSASRRFSTVSEDPTSEESLINDEILFPKNDCTAYTTFSTANGKSISVSKVALSKANALLTENECNHTASSTGKEELNALFDDFKGETIGMSKNILIKTSTLSYNNCNSKYANEVPISTENPIKVSEKLLVRERTHSARKESCHPDIPELSTTELESSNLEGLPRNGSTLFKKIYSNEHKFSGFSTARGKSIRVSEEALIKARTLLSEKENFDTNLTELPTDERKSILPSEETHSKTNTLLHEKESDEIAYCGFSTAKGKSIPVSDEALAKAKQLLHEETSDENTFCGFSTAKGKSIPVSDKALSKAKQLLYEETDDGNTFCGFSTAKGKSIPVSDEALSKAKPLLHEETSDGNVFCGFSTAKGKSIPVSDEALSKAKQLLHEETSDGNVFCGFSTAKGKSIPVSDEALSKAKQLLHEETSDGNVFCGFSTAKRKSIPVSDEALSKAKQLLHEETSDGNVFCGFSTAKGKSIPVSDEALSKAKQLLHEETSDGNVFCGFSTAKGKSIPVSDEALAKAKLLLHEEISDGNVFRGFSTAKGKSIPVSDEALSKAKELLHEETSDGNVFCGFSTAKGKSIPVSDEALSKAKQLLHEETSDGNVFCGFSTAKRKSIPVSDEALSEAKHLLHEETSDGNVFCGFSTAKGKSIPVSDEALSKAKQLLHEETSDGNVFCGFSTAKGKSIPVSDEALSKAKQLLHEETSDGNVFCGFSTAKGKSIPVSDEAIVKAKQLLHEETSDENTFCGYSTAKGKLIKFSDKALAKAKQLLHEETSDGNVFCGFSTAKGKSIPVSDEALSKAKQLLHEETSDGNVFCGFSTAKGKSIPVSDEALSKAKQLLHEETSDGNVFCGFSTAKGKSIPVSDEALSKAKQLLHEETSDGNVFCGFSTAKRKSIPVSDEALSKAKQLLHEETSDGNVFCGFSTAKGKSIPVSDEALSKAKQLLHEETSDGNVFCGFSTAKGKSIPVSDEALSKAKQLLHEETSDGNVFCGFSTAKGKSIPVSDEALSKAKELLHEETSDGNVFCGFSTAKGKSIPVSDEALSKAKQLLHEETSYGNVFCGFSTAKRKSIPVSDEALSEAKHLLHEETSDGNVFCGFSTAKGKLIPVSDEALSKAKQLLHEETSDGNVFCGFSTAKGKSIPVSDEALSKAKQLLHEETSDGNVFCGFSTAKGKSIPVSDEALSKAKQLLHEETSDGNVFCGFSTAKGKSIPVSDEAIVKAKQLLHEETSDENTFCGYSTAKGKLIKFSDKALAKARTLLHKETSEGNAFFGFSTAKGKSIPVSEEALAKAKTHLYENEYDEDAFLSYSTAKDESVLVSNKPSVKAKTCFQDNKSFGDEICGFSTVEGQSIVTSVEPLAKARILLSDEDEKLNTCNESILDNENHKVDTISEQLSLEDSCINKHFLSQSPDKYKPSPNRHSQFYEDMPCLSLSFVDEVSESTAAFLADEDVPEFKDPPVWLRTFVTSPSFVQDRSEALSPILCTDSEIKMRKKRACSPVLGVGDRFKIRKKRLKFSKSKLDENQVAGCSTPIMNSKLKKNQDDPYNNFIDNLKTSTPISINRTKIKRTIQIDEPNCACEKKLKMMDSWDDDSQVDQTIFYQLDVIEGRRKATENQELLLKNGKDKSLTKMQKGALFVKRQLGQRIPLRSLVKSPRTLLSTAQLIGEGIKQSVIGINYENAAEFRFSSSNSLSKYICESNCDGIPVGDNALVILSDDGSAGLKEISRAFLASPGIDPTLISHEWIANHFRSIVWKLASTERNFPHLLAGSYLTLDNVLLQLRYRYDREIDDCQRSCLRKILETDESAARRMVLCVSEILVNKSSATKELKLTDGWYRINASVDEEMMCLIDRGKVAVGTKLVVQGCELLNCEQGHDPLHVPNTVQLKLHTNCARRARWDCRLGFCQTQGPILVGKLKDVLPKGGNIGRIDVLVVRVYPLVYMLKTEDGKSVVYSKKREEQECLLNERRMTELIEKLQSQVQREMDEMRNRKSNSNQDEESLPSQDLVESGQIPTRDQMRIMTNLREQKQRKYQEILRQKLDEKMSENCPEKRKSIPMLKVRVIDARASNEDKNSTLQTAMLTVWKPTEDVENVLVEGNTISLYSVTAHGKRSGELQLSTGRQTKYSVGAKSEAFSRKCHFLCDISRSLNPLFSEINTVGLVVHVENSSTSVETAYLTDDQNNYLGVRFWGGIKKYGWQSCVCVGSEISCSNLEWRSTVSRSNVPYVFVTELSVFSSNPRSKYLQNALDQFKNSIKRMDMKELLSKSKEHLLDMLNGGGTGNYICDSFSKMSSVSVSGETSAITPSNKNLLAESPLSSVKSKMLMEKMQKLLGYGNPPAITAMPSLQVSPALKKDFKTPNRKSL